MRLPEPPEAGGPAEDPAAPGGMLSADELLAGAALTYEVEVPAALLAPERLARAGRVRLRPLTIRDLQLVSRAARDNDSLTAALMVQTALVEPKLTPVQINGMPVGLMEFLLGEVNRISGLASPPGQIEAAAAEPIARAAHLLARHFGWTPDQVNALTLGQVLLHLQALREPTPTHV